MKSVDADVAAARGRAAFFSHQVDCATCTKAWFGSGIWPDRASLCSRGRALHRLWWALEEA